MAREEHKHGSHCLILERGPDGTWGQADHVPRAHSQSVVLCSQELGHPGQKQAVGIGLPVWDVPPPTQTPSAVRGDQL